MQKPADYGSEFANTQRRHAPTQVTPFSGLRCKQTCVKQECREFVTTATLVSASLSKLSCSRAQTPMAPLKLFDLQRSGRTCMNSDEPARGANRSHLLLLLHICQATPPPLLPPSSRQRATGVGAQSCVCAARGQAEPNPVLTEEFCC